MTTLQPLEVKTIYSASKHRGRRVRPVRVGGSTGTSLPVLIGVLSLVVTAALYYGTWWKADPKLRVLILMRTKLPGVSLDALPRVNPDATASAIARPDTGNPGNPSMAPPPASTVTPEELQAQMKEAKIVPVTVTAWAAVVTITTAVLALAGGAVLGYGLERSKRTWLGAVGLLAVAGLGWAIYSIWAGEGRFVPVHLRLGVLSGLLILVILGLIIARGGSRLAFVASVLLILSAAASVVALYLCVQHELFKPEELPLALLPLCVVVFIAQSLWGWILLPVAPRLRATG